MGRPVRIAAAPISEADIQRAILKFAKSTHNVDLDRNTRGRYQDSHGNWITYGVGPNGASDLIGYRVIRILPNMVGARLAQFTAIEVKDAKGKPSLEQQIYLDNIIAAGGCAGVCRSVEEAAALLLDIEKLKRKIAA